MYAHIESTTIWQTKAPHHNNVQLAPSLIMSEIASATLVQKILSLRAWVDRGGPEPREYESVRALFSEIGELRFDGDRALIQRAIGESSGAFNTPETNQGFVCLTPHGYHGDFEIIDRIYANRISENGHFRRWDEYFQATTASRAVRGRCDYMLKMVGGLARQWEASRMLNVASGPGQDLWDLFIANPELAACLKVHCIDQERQCR